MSQRCLFLTLVIYAKHFLNWYINYSLFQFVTQLRERLNKSYYLLDPTVVKALQDQIQSAKQSWYDSFCHCQHFECSGSEVLSLYHDYTANKFKPELLTSSLRTYFLDHYTVLVSPRGSNVAQFWYFISRLWWLFESQSDT